MNSYSACAPLSPCWPHPVNEARIENIFQLQWKNKEKLDIHRVKLENQRVLNVCTIATSS